MWINCENCGIEFQQIHHEEFCDIECTMEFIDNLESMDFEDADS